MFEKKVNKYEIQKKNPDISILTVPGSLELAASIQMKENKRCNLGQRHLVTFFGFLNFFLLYTNRLALAVGIVAMVKHRHDRHENETSKWNSSEISCPMPSTPPKPDVGSNFQGEFNWSTELQGYVLGAGFLSYFIMLAPGGRLADAIGSKSLLVYSNAFAGILTIISPFMARWHVYALIVAQFLRGASQGITCPAVYRMMSNWIPRAERGLLNSLLVCGFPAGVAIGGLVTGWLCDIPGLGWPSAFYIWGSICFVIAIVMHFTLYEHPMNNPWITAGELKYISEGLETEVAEKPPSTPWKRIFASIPIYAYIYGLFGHFWGLGFFSSVHPNYMGTVLHFSMAENGLASCLPNLACCISGTLAGVASHWVSKKNWIGLNMLRKIATACSTFGFSFCMVGILLAGCNNVINVLCFVLSLFCLGISNAGIEIAGMDMAPTFAGSVMGVASSVSALGNFLLPVITGLPTTHETLFEWQKVFWLNIGVVGNSGLVFVLFGSAEVQSWNYPEDKHPTEAINDGRTDNKNTHQSIEIKENLEMKMT